MSGRGRPGPRARWRADAAVAVGGTVLPRFLYVLFAGALASLAWSALTSRWEWGLLSILAVALAASWGRDGRDPGAAAPFVAVPLLALPLLDLAGLEDNLLSPLAVLAGVFAQYFICLSFMALFSLRTAFRTDPHGLLAAALLASVSVATLAQLGAYYADLLLYTDLLPDNAALMWPLTFHLGGSLLLTGALAWSEPALRLLKLPEVGL